MTTGVTARLASLRTNAPAVMKGFGELGRASMADWVLDMKTKELIALVLSVTARCASPRVGYRSKALVKLGAPRQELGEMLGVVV